MSKGIAVSFEGESVKIAYGSRSNGSLTVTRTFAVKDEEFDLFLAREQIRDFTVVFSFKTFYQDVLLLPPVEEKYLETLLLAEVKKNAPELKDGMFFYTVLREKVHEGRPAREVFVFGTDGTEINDLLERFSRHGKRVKNLYADVFVLSKLIAASNEIQEKTVLGLLGMEDHKTLFLVRDGKLTFARNIQSRGKGMDQYDVANVNMTVNYARQTLREHPDELVIVNGEKEKDFTLEGIALPTSLFECPAAIIGGEGKMTEFVLPIAGLFVGKGSGRESLLPSLYSTLLLEEKVLRWGVAVFLVLSFLSLGYIFSEWNQARQIQKIIAPLRADIAERTQVYEDLEAKRRALQGALPYIRYLQAESATPDIRQSLLFLQVFHKEKVTVRDVEIKSTGQDLALQIKGHIRADTYGELQSRFRKLIDDVRASEGVQGVSEKLDLVARDFSVDVRWKQ